MGRIGARYVSLVWDTSELIVEPESAADLIRRHQPFIFAMWHGQFMMQPALHKTLSDIRASALLARHGDAEALGALLQAFNIDLVRGAGAGERTKDVRYKDRGGAYALRTALKLLKSGSTFCLTADVPPGPARKSGMGIVTLAQLSGRPIIPFAAATSRYVAFKSWSRMTVNLPFGKLAYVIGEPLFVPREAAEPELERLREEVEKALDRVTARAYGIVGADPRRATPPKRLDASSRPAEPGFALKVYRGAMSVAGPAAAILLAVRERQGKEDPHRLRERYGEASRERPAGPLVWVHAASVGETNAVLPLMTRLKEKRPDLGFLLTTGTVTSAGVAHRRMPAGSIHQYLPLDVPEYARRFLDHWRPDLALFTESEVWPNLILETHARAIPLALVNARISGRSFKRWSRNKRVAEPLFGRFDVVLAQNSMIARWIRSLGGRNVVVSGNLKIDAPPPPAEEGELERLRNALARRPVFIAASTHEGEEEIVAAAHRDVAKSLPGLCTIIVPRHPERGTGVAERLRAQGYAVAQRSAGQPPADTAEIYVADTIGELGLFYALAPVAFVGGSLVDKGGQNPIEAVSLGAAVLTGPHWRNFIDAYRTLLRHRGAAEVHSKDELASAVARLLTEDSERQRMCDGARAALLTLGGALERTLEALEPQLPAVEGLRRAS
jgi:3-deoxy-D-manno-octulosonic-acid transferase